MRAWRTAQLTLSLRSVNTTVNATVNAGENVGRRGISFTNAFSRISNCEIKEIPRLPAFSQR